jgi:hypothetical protein
MTREFNSCTIIRTFNREHYTLDLSTNQRTFIKKETVTEPCNIPLFSGDFRKVGVCRACANGWTTESNVFATPAEFDRAAAAKP